MRRDTSSGNPSSASALPAILTFVLLALLESLAIHQLQPPAAVPASAPPTEFSSARALQHLKVIAQKPHPTGSGENARVREYLVGQLKGLGLNPEVQSATATFMGKGWHGPGLAGAVDNIVTMLKGKANTRAVMLTAHYDSVSTGPGASDDGSGTVTLLETARALKSGPPLRNDVIFLITDGEESGLLGARAFVEGYSTLRGIGLVMNFEARGACGPSVMFETSAHNGWLIQQFAQAAPHPISSSFTYEAYKRLPNDTDLTIFKRAGLAGLNFAYAGCWPRYHTMGDSVQNIDERSLQHHGSYALALTRHFGNLDLSHTAGEDAVYVSLFGATLHYPVSWIIPLLIAALLLFIGVGVLGFRKRQLTVQGILLGFLGWLLGTAVAAGFSVALWRVLRGTRFVSLLPYGMAYNGDFYAATFVALTVAVICALYVRLQRKTGVANLTVGALASWAILAAVMSFYAPGGSYMFVWPLLFSLVELGYAFAGRNPEAEEESFLVWTLPAIVGILLFGTMPYLLIQLLSTSGLVIVTVVTALLLGFLVPHIHIITARTNWLLPGTAAVVALAFIVVGMLESGYDANHPRADSLFYVLNSDTGKAVWASADDAPDAWTSQFLTGGVEKASLNDFRLGQPTFPVLEAEAPQVQLAPPEVTTLDDVTFGEERTLRLLISSPRGARVLWVIVEKARVLGAEVNGKKLEGGGSDRGSWRVVYAGLPKAGLQMAGMVLTVTVPLSEAPTVRVIDQSDGLPEVPAAAFKPRPDELMPSPRVLFDSSTLVTKTFQHYEMSHMKGHY